MSVDKKYHDKIKTLFKDLFETETYIGIQNHQYGGFDGLMAVIDEPLVKQQVIELAKFSKDISLNTTLKAFGGKIIIEFWQA